MGTSQDYEVAAEEGATIVRLGSVLYDWPQLMRDAAEADACRPVVTLPA